MVLDPEFVSANLHLRSRIVGMGVQCAKYRDGSVSLVIDGTAHQEQIVGRSGILVTHDRISRDILALDVPAFHALAERENPALETKLQSAFEDSFVGEQAARDLFVDLAVLAVPALAEATQRRPISDWIARQLGAIKVGSRSWLQADVSGLAPAGSLAAAEPGHDEVKLQGKSHDGRLEWELQRLASELWLKISTDDADLAGSEVAASIWPLAGGKPRFEVRTRLLEVAPGRFGALHMLGTASAMRTDDQLVVTAVTPATSLEPESERQKSGQQGVSILGSFLASLLRERDPLGRLRPEPRRQLAWGAVRQRGPGRRRQRPIKLIMDEEDTFDGSLENHFVLLPDGTLKAVVHLQVPLTIRRGHYSVLLTAESLKITAGTFHDAVIIIDQTVSDWFGLSDELRGLLRNIGRALVLDDAIQINISQVRAGDLVQPTTIRETGRDSLQLIDDLHRSVAELRVYEGQDKIRLELVAGEAWFEDGAQIESVAHVLPNRAQAYLRSILRIRAS